MIKNKREAHAVFTIENQSCLSKMRTLKFNLELQSNEKRQKCDFKISLLAN